MSEPFASAAQILAAIEKLINSWQLALTLTITVVLFVQGQEFDWFKNLPQIISILGALGLAALSSMTLLWLLKVAFSFVSQQQFKRKHSVLTDHQIAILQHCLSRDETHFQFRRLGTAPELGQYLQGFLQSGLARVDGQYLIFDRDYWKWLNPRRKSIIEQRCSVESQTYVKEIVSRVEPPRRPQSWMG